MPGEEVHPPLTPNDATQSVVPAPEIDRLDCEIDPNTRWKGQQWLPQPANERGHVGWVAALVETKPKARAQLKLDLLDRRAAEPHRQQRQSVAFRAGAPGRLVEVVFQRRVGHAVFGDLRAWKRTFLGLGYGGRPKLDSAD